MSTANRIYFVSSDEACIYDIDFLTFFCPSLPAKVN